MCKICLQIGIIVRFYDDPDQFTEFLMIGKQVQCIYFDITDKDFY